MSSEPTTESEAGTSYRIIVRSVISVSHSPLEEAQLLPHRALYDWNRAWFISHIGWFLSVSSSCLWEFPVCHLFNVVTKLPLSISYAHFFTQSHKSSF